MLAASKIVVRTPFYAFAPRQLKEIFEMQLHSAIFKEALFLGSPDLYEAFEKTQYGISEEIRLSLYKYFLRMSYRCTPFGMFSGVSSGTIGNVTSFILPAQQSYRKYTRLDNHFINTFIQKILADSAMKASVSWYANNTIYRNDNAIRYVEYRLANNQRSHHLAKVETSTYLDIILKKTQRGAKIKELTVSILSDEITEQDAIAFIDELIADKLLLSELEPVVTGQEPYKKVLEILEQYKSNCTDALFLKRIIDQIHCIESQPPGTAIRQYKEILDQVKEWDVKYDPKLIFQSDLSKPTAQMQLSARVLDELKAAISFLMQLNGPVVHSTLNKFKEEFTKRYEDSEVPLLEALDTESGIGYPAGAHASNDQSPLLEGLSFKSTSPVAEYRMSEWQKKLADLYQQCVAQGKTELVVTDETFLIDRKLVDVDLLPDSMYTICSVLATPKELEGHQFTIDYKGSSGPSAANLLGRFCYLDSEIKSIVDELIDQEGKLQPDKIFAEIVHLAQARVGNVLIRPSLRKYEIPVLTFSSVDNHHTIALDDIMVSIKSNRIVLRSKKLDREVLPRNTTAHNYANDTVPYYYFLCDLQQQDNRTRLNWDWGMLNEFKFLPRVKYGCVILSKARWIVDEKDLLVNIAKQAFSDFRFEIQKHQQAHCIPKWVVLCQSDNQLLLDLSDELCLRIVKQELFKSKRIILEECLFNESNLLVRGPEGGYTNEIIIPWTKQVEKPIQSNPKQSSTSHTDTQPDVQHTFQPGDEWHYMKIYCGVKTADKILVEVVKPITEALLAENKINKWFFIRYADPDHHLRIRFCGQGNFYAEVTERFNKGFDPYLQNHLIWKIQTDTYNRELERYGSANIENSETLFFHDAEAAIQILSLLEGDEGDDLRWQFAFKGVHDLLTSFGLDLAAKMKLMSVISTNFLKEFNGDNVETKRQLSTKYRSEKFKIQAILQNEVEESNDFYPVWQIFAERNKNVAPCVAHIHTLIEQNKLGVSKSDLLASYIHMFLNRFLRSKQRLQEMVIYDLLYQHYKSHLARIKNNSPVPH